MCTFTLCTTTLLMLVCVYIHNSQLHRGRAADTSYSILNVQIDARKYCTHSLTYMHTSAHTSTHTHTHTYTHTTHSLCIQQLYTILLYYFVVVIEAAVFKRCRAQSLCVCAVWSADFKWKSLLTQLRDYYNRGCAIAPPAAQHAERSVVFSRHHDAVHVLFPVFVYAGEAAERTARSILAPSSLSLAAKVERSIINLLACMEAERTAQCQANVIWFSAFSIWSMNNAIIHHSAASSKHQSFDNHAYTSDDR